MEATAWLNASRNPRAADGLRSAYQFLALSASASAPGCQVGSIEATEEALSHFGPRDRLDLSGIELVDSPTDFGVPSLLGIRIHLAMKALDENPCHRSTILLVESERLLEQMPGFGSHAASVPLPLPLPCLDNASTKMKLCLATHGKISYHLRGRKVLPGSAGASPVVRCAWG